MHLRHLVLVLFLINSAQGQTMSLLGQSMLRPVAKRAGQSVAYAGVAVVEEGELQQARGEKADAAKATADLWNGAFLVDGATWVLGEQATLAAARRLGRALVPGGVIANFGAELLSNGATAAYKRQPMPVRELLARSAVSAVGGAIGSALIPIPIVGWAVGTIAADLLYERVVDSRRHAHPHAT